MGSFLFTNQDVYGQCGTTIHTGDFTTASFVTACQGTSPNLQVQAQNAGTDWYFSSDGVSFTTITLSSSFMSVGVVQPGYYKAFISCATTFTSVVEVNFISSNAPVIQEGTFLTACVGSPINLTATSSSLGYQWEYKPDGGSFNVIAGNQQMITASQLGEYRVKFITGCNLGFSSVTRVQFISALTINEGTFITGCASNTPSLSTQTGYSTYIWQFSSDGGNTFNTIGSNAPSVSTSSGGIGMYKVGIDPGCGVLFSTITVVQFQSAGTPVIQQGAFITACAGNTPTLSSNSSSLGYLWEHRPIGGTFNQIAGNQQMITANQAGEYRVKFISSCQNTFSSVTRVDFVSTPTINQGSFITTCAGNAPVLTTQTGAIGYNWQFSNNGGASFISIGTNASFVSANSAGIYKVSLNNGCITPFSTVTTVQFTSSAITPTISQGTFISTCPGQNNILTTNQQAQTYTWAFSTVNIVGTFTTVGSNSNQLTFNSVGFYKVQTSNSCGSAFSSATQVQFNTVPAPIIQQGAFITACAGNTPNLSANTSSLGYLGYVWEYKPSGGTFNQIAGNQLMITANQAGEYRVRFMTGCNLNFSSVTRVDFISTPTINQGTFITACASNAPILSTQTGAIGYNWQFSNNGGASFISIGTNAPFVSASSAGIYKVSLNHGCVTPFSTVTTVQFTTSAVIPIISQGVFVSACPGQNNILNTNQQAQNYIWSFSPNNTVFTTVGSNSSQLAFSSAGFYKVQTSNGCGSAFSSVTQVQFTTAPPPVIQQGTFITSCGNPVNLIATSSNLGYHWEYQPIGGTFRQIAGNQPMITADVAGEYRVRFVSACQNTFSSVTRVEFISTPTINQGTFLTACASNAPILSTQTNAIGFNWQYSNNGGASFISIGTNAPFVSANSAGIYKVGLNHGCGTLFSTVTTIQFTTSAVTPIISQGTFLTACAPSELTVTNVQAQTYQWYHSTNNINFATIGNNSNQLNFNTGGYYKVSANDGCETAFSTVTLVQFTSAIHPVIQQGAVVNSCGNPPTLNAQAGQAGYVWEFRPNAGVAFNTVPVNAPQITANQAGEYRVKFSNGCQNQFSSVTRVQFASVATIQEGAFVSACTQGTAPVLHATLGGTAYQWQYAQQQGDNFISVNNATTAFLSADIAGFYRVGVDLGCGLKFTSTTQIVFTTSVQPTITEAPFISACPNSTVKLHAQGAGSFQWQKVVPNGLNVQIVDIPGATNSTLDVLTDGVYRVVFTSAQGCAGRPSDPVEVKFVSAEIPLINTDAIDPYAVAVPEYQQSGGYENNGGQKWQVAVCNGGSIELKTETGAQQYQWFYTQNWNQNWIAIPNSNSSTLTVTTAQRRYKVRVTRPNGCPTDSRPIWVMTANGTVNTPVVEQGSVVTLQSGQIKLTTQSGSWRNKWQYAPSLSQPFVTVAYDRNDFSYDYQTRKYTLTARKAGFYRVYNTNGCQVLFSTVVEVRENTFNDPPNFKISERYGWFSVRNDIGKHQRCNFITAIDDGDSDLEQTVSFFVTADDPSLFTVQPYIDATGKLCFTPNPNKGGYTSLRIYAKDNGAGNNPNINTSQVQNCRVWIMPKNYVFLDMNKDGVYDQANEFPAVRKRVKVKKKSYSSSSTFYNWTTYTRDDGSYYAYVYPTRNGAGYYKFEPYTPDYPTGANFVPTKYEDNNVTQRGYLSGKHFAVQPTSEVDDVSTQIMTWWAWNSRPGFTTYYYIKCENNGTKVKNSIVTFKYDELLTVEGTKVYRDNGNNTQLLGITNNTASWICNNLKPGETRYIAVKVRIQAPTANRTLLGERLHCFAEIIPTGGDDKAQNNKYTSIRVIRGSYDPNDKAVTPAGDVPPQFVKDGEFLKYRVRFQNSGTDTAFNIRVEDQLADKLDWNSLEMLGASHDYRMEIDSTGKAVWYFSNILLPDDKTDEPGSHGHFDYRIKIKNDGSVNLGDQFGSKAYIYFDYNTPIITNQPDTRVWADLVAPKKVTFIPANGAINVASDSDLSIEFDEKVKINKGRIHIRQADGTLIQTIDITSDKVSIQDNILQIDPTSLVPANARTEGDFEVYVQVDNGAIQDLATNQFDGVSGTNTWRFTVSVPENETNNSVTQPVNNDFVQLPAPASVSGLQAGTVTANTVSLNWNASTSPVDGYKIFRKTANGEFISVGIIGEVSFQDENVEPNTTYEYKIVAFNNGGDSEGQTVIVQTLPATPTITTSEVTICEGSQATLTASGTSTDDVFNWYDSETSTTVLDSGATISVSKAGTYYVAVLANGKESQRVSARVIVNAIPTAKIQDGERVFCGSGQIEAENVSGASYSWKNANGDVVGTSSALTVNESGTYSVTVAKAGCSATSESVSVTVNSTNITAEILNGRNAEFCNSGQLNAKAVSGATYEWSKDGQVLSNTNSTLTVSESGKYSLRILVNGCTSNITSISVKIVTPETPAIRADLTTIYETQETVLRSDYLEDAVLTWYKDGQLLEGKFGNRIVVSEAGQYSVKAVYDAGCETTSEVITIATKAKPTIQFVNDELTVSGITDDSEVQSIIWYRDGKPVVLVDGKPTEGGVYTVVITLKDGSKLSLEGVQVAGEVLSTEAENSYGFESYPNPTPGVFNISATNDYRGKVQIMIIDGAGRVVYDKTIKKTSETMVYRPNVKDWSKGAYILKITFGENQITRTIIKE